MSDFINHMLYNLTSLELLLICIICFSAGFVIGLIIMIEKTKIKYTEYDKQPWRMSLVIGHKGSIPVYGQMYNEKFVKFLWSRLKKQWARIEAIKKMTGEKT